MPGVNQKNVIIYFKIFFFLKPYDIIPCALGGTRFAQIKTFRFPFRSTNFVQFNIQLAMVKNH